VSVAEGIRVETVDLAIDARCTPAISLSIDETLRFEIMIRVSFSHARVRWRPEQFIRSYGAKPRGLSWREGPRGSVVWWVSIVSVRALLARFCDGWAIESKAERPRMKCSLFNPTEVAKPPKSTPHALEIDRRP